MASSSGGRDDAPDNHAGRQVQGRLPELVEEEVGGDLHQQVAHEEDGHGGLVLGRRQPEVLLQARELGGRDVVPVFVVGRSVVGADISLFVTLVGGSGPPMAIKPRGEGQERWGLESGGCGACARGGKLEKNDEEPTCRCS